MLLNGVLLKFVHFVSQANKILLEISAYISLPLTQNEVRSMKHSERVPILVSFVLRQRMRSQRNCNGQGC